MTTNMHSSSDEQEFSRWLLELGSSSFTSEVEVTEGMVEIPTSSKSTGTLIEGRHLYRYIY